MDIFIQNKLQLRVCVVILVGLLVVGAWGFYFLGDGRTPFESIYLAAVILTTVGMKDSGPPLSGAEQGWALILMLTGILAVLYAGSVLVAFLVEGDLRNVLGKRQLKTKIGRLRGHFIVCGFGRMGRMLCESLHGRGAGFVLVEAEEERAEEAEGLGYLVVAGDAQAEQTLTDAGVEGASGLAACLPTDAANVFVTLTARGMNQKMTIISRAERAESDAKLHRAGADRVICLPVIGATRATQMLMRSGVDELLEAVVSGETDLTISKVHLDQVPGAVGRSLRELALPSQVGVMVVAVVPGTGAHIFNPPPDRELEAADELIVIGPTSGVDRMIEKLAAV